MMIIDVRKLNALRKFQGDVQLEVAPDPETVSLPNVEIAAPIEAKGTYEIFQDDSVQITGKVRYLLRGACTRCLKQTEKWIETEWNPCFVKDEPQEEEYPYERGAVYLEQSVKDAVMLSMPFTLLCSEDCQGIAYNHQGEEEL